MAMSLEPTSSSSSLLRSSGATSLPYLFLNNSQFANIENIYAILPDMTDALKAHVAQMTQLLAIQDNQAMLSTNGAGGGNALIAQPLLSATGAQSYINYTDGDGCTPLFKAACNGHAPVVAQLIVSRCSINLATTKGLTPLGCGQRGAHFCCVTAHYRAAMSTLRRRMERHLSI
jgi:hypothetical protein